ncbi:glycosyltransferase family 4 protein [Shewanella sp. KCT]|uniref:glycosyltransferase family 4 protein n=1 Tax=Shewanella sp. KCT TaxID=2569535 RepID=UPI0011824DB2|nr:glycosyltransferase family 4 protein [Shewanella sp. KCT]TVP10596.1 hypothetical protein AYI87_17710 [Shewanella sp. KCT]
MDVVHVISSFQLGGAEKVAIDIAKFSKKNNISCSIASVFGRDDAFSESLKSDLNESGITWFELSSKKSVFSFAQASFSLALFIKRNNIRIVHCHSDIPDFIVSLAIRILKILFRFDIKVVRTIHNTELWSKRRFIPKVVESGFVDDHVVLISKAVESSYLELRSRCGYEPSKNRHLIYNGVNFQDDVDFSYLSKVNSLSLLFVGRFVYQKGVDVFIKALKELSCSLDRDSNVNVDFYGSGEDVDIILSAKLKNINLKVFPPDKNIVSKFKAYDFIVMPSRFEGLPLVAIEAASCKIPIIVADSPGLNETIPSNWPLIFDTDNFFQLSNLLKDILDGRFDKSLLGLELFEFSKSKFGVQKMIDSYCSIYESLLE